MILTQKGAASRRRRSGFSLVEIAMVLAIVALLVAGIMLFFSNANTAQRTNDAMAELAAIQQTVRSLYSGQADYTGLDAVLVGNSRQMPAKWVRGTIGSATGLSSPFGAAVNVAAATTTTTNDSFTIAMTGVPAQACNKMVTMDLGTSLISLRVGSTAAAVTGRAMTAAEANGACVNNNAQTITWTLN